MTRAGWASLPFFSLHLFFPYFNLDIFFVTPSFPSLILLCFNLFVHSPPPSSQSHANTDTTIVNRRPNPMLPLPFSCFRQHVPEGLTLTDWEHEQFSKSAPKVPKNPTGLSVNFPGGAASEGTAGGENAGMYVDIYIYIYKHIYIHTHIHMYI